MNFGWYSFEVLRQGVVISAVCGFDKYVLACLS